MVKQCAPFTAESPLWPKTFSFTDIPLTDVPPILLLSLFLLFRFQELQRVTWQIIGEIWEILGKALGYRPSGSHSGLGVHSPRLGKSLDPWGIKTHTSLLLAEIENTFPATFLVTVSVRI